MIEHLQLLETSSVKERFNIIFNLGYSSSNIKRVLEYTHLECNRVAILTNKENVTIGSTQYSYGEAVDKLVEPLDKLTLPSDMYYVIFLLASNVVTQTTRNKLQEALEYTPYIRKKARVSSWATKCNFCDAISTSNLCWRCKANIVEYTEHRRENFIVPVTYLNFKKFTEVPFNLRYKDWEIIRSGDKLCYVLKQELYESTVEDYELPFVEYQKPINS